MLECLPFYLIHPHNYPLFTPSITFLSLMLYTLPVKIENVFLYYFKQKTFTVFFNFQIEILVLSFQVPKPQYNVSDSGGFSN